MERALKCWSSGTLVEDLKKFSGDNYSGRVSLFSRIAGALREEQWRSIINAAYEMAARRSRSRSPSVEVEMIDLTGEDTVDPADLAAMDEDLDN